MTLTAQAILDVLDRSAASDWQEFSETAELEYHAMRLIAVRSRSGDDWGLILDSIRGSVIDKDAPVACGSWTKVYGSRIEIGMHLVQRTCPVPLKLPEERVSNSVRLDGLEIDGPAGKLMGEDAMIERFDLRPGRVCNFEGYAKSSLDVLALRAYLARFPGSLWAPVEEVAAAAGVEDGEILFVSDAFHHVIGPRDIAGREQLAPIAVPPSASPSYQSVAEAIASRDASRFVPGESNLDWRIWATFEDDDVDPEAPPIEKFGPAPVPRPDVVQPEVPEISTGDAKRDELLRTLTGALAELKQQAALEALVKRNDPALPGILVSYLSDAFLDIKPQLAPGWDELRKLPEDARRAREEQGHREALAFSSIVSFVQWSMRALAALRDPAGDERLIQIFSTPHAVARVRSDAGNAIVRPGEFEEMNAFPQRPALGSRRALEGVAALLDHLDEETDHLLIQFAALAALKLDPAKGYDRLAPLIFDGDEIRKGKAADVLLGAAASTLKKDSDPRWRALGVRLLQDERRQQSALHFFASYAPPEIAEPLGAMLKAGVAVRVVNLVVVRLLGETGTPEAARHLLVALGDRSLDARFHREIATALGAAGNRSMIPELEALAATWKDDASLNEAIREAIGQLERR